MALMDPKVDLEKVRDGFEKGGNDPSDIPGMIKLLIRFHNNKYIFKAVGAWTQGDLLLHDLSLEADKLHQTVLRGHGPDAVQTSLNRIAELNSQLTRQEIRFSSSLGEGSRWLEKRLMTILALLVFTVESTGIFLTFRFSRNLTRSLSELQDAAVAVRSGDFSVLAPIHSHDELGQLAQSLNEMTRTLKTNIGERNRAQEKLKQLNEDLEQRVSQRTREVEQRASQFRLITNTELVAQVDCHERFLVANNAFCRWFEQVEGDIIGKSFKSVLGEKRYEVSKPQIDKVLSGKTATFERLSESGEASLIFNVTYIPELDSTGKVVSFIIVAVDVSKYKKIESELMGAKEAADTASATKSAFLANMSHEIRTPLGAVLGFSELIATQRLNPSDLSKYAEVIKRNGRLLSNIINDILDLSKVEAGKLDIEQIDIEFEEIVNEIKSLLELEATGKGIKLTMIAEGTIPSVIKTDPLRLRQVLLNVIGNAIKFTNKGSVEVRVKLQPTEDENIKLAFFVKDTGKGIEAEQANRLFEPFTQGDASTTRKFGGTGLGLVLAKKLANALGGDVILAESEPRVGSTFVVTIDPGAAERVFFENFRQSSKTDAQNFDRLVNLKDIKVLVADNSFDNLTLISQLLRYGGAEVETAMTGKEAMEKAMSGTFNMVLMDLQMPIMDGYEAVRELRARGYAGPIIAITAHAMKEEGRKCLASGFDGHLTKPIDSDKLMLTISQFANSKSTHIV